MNDVKYKLRGGWLGRPEGPTLIARNFARTLDGLSIADPIFARWHVMDTRNLEIMCLDAARSKLAEIVENCVCRADFDEPDPDAGYHASASTTERDDPRSFNFSVRAGAKRDSEVELEAGPILIAPDIDVVSFKRFYVSLGVVVDAWRPNWLVAYAYRREYDKAPAVHGRMFPGSRFHMPWLAYLDAETSTGLVAPPGVARETTSDGGTLMIATTERFDVDDPIHVERAHSLADIMLERVGATG